MPEDLFEVRSEDVRLRTIVSSSSTTSHSTFPSAKIEKAPEIGAQQTPNAKATKNVSQVDVNLVGTFLSGPMNTSVKLRRSLQVPYLYGKKNPKAKRETWFVRRQSVGTAHFALVSETQNARRKSSVRFESRLVALTTLLLRPGSARSRGGGRQYCHWQARCLHCPRARSGRPLRLHLESADSWS